MSEEEDSKKLMAVQSAIKSNDLSEVQKSFRKLNITKRVSDKIYEFCAKFKVQTSIYEWIHNKLKNRFVCSCGEGETIECFCDKSSPVKPKVIKTAIESDNKDYVVFAHSVEAIHGNFFLHGMELESSLEMLKWLKDTFGAWSTNSEDYFDHDTQDYFHSLNVYGLAVKHLSRYEDLECLRYCFDVLIDLISEKRFVDFLYSEAIYEDNLELIKLMNEKGLLCKKHFEEKFHSVYLFPEIYEWMINQGYMQLDSRVKENFYNKWNQLLATNSEEISAVYTSHFWRTIFFNDFIGENKYNNYEYMFLQRYIEIAHEKIELQKGALRTKCVGLPKDIIEFRLIPMI